ncbi:3',5'-cyclic-AMP phosphodiesterase [Vibrio breoganii]|uniref:3',5'-cyclic-AMP phosphodiesterase n=1 Tax=Vibrio breoganii TaxID=553239 RepID=UPI000C83D1DD|nr:3',5'-cyclic-AMP phosphodiesterase [Vibrio breoganii]PMM10638.1 3',5'-cyclic-AMP phosphodiesterase [Vibrio breoganii]
MEPQIVATEETVQLVQITDTHLFADDEGCLLSVNTGQSFIATVNDIVERNVEFDAIVATGDISQDHSAASYTRFADGIKPLEKQCYWLPGNHDQKSNMVTVLPSPQIKEVGHVLAGEYWQIIMLDSQVEGLPHGYLETEQLELLDNKLAEFPERHTLVLLHHNALPIGSAWLDQHKLQRAHQFWEVLGRHQNVRAVLGGHVHQDFEKEHNGVRVLATPSTCIQFKANNDEFALDTLSPGWRHLQLHKDGQLESQVYRLEEGCFIPDFEAEGY